MPLITLPAHFDGEKICLDEPYKLKPNIQLMVTVLSTEKDKYGSVKLRLGDLPEVFHSLPHLSEGDLEDFERDIYNIRIDFEKEELNNPWGSS